MKNRSNGNFIVNSIDILMLLVVITNLAYLIFDWSFENSTFQLIVKNVSNDFFIYYQNNIHPNLFFYESIFVSIFVIELALQWIISIISKKYVKWWLYPILHWYDVLGCIPLGYFVWLRLFRIIAMLLRLHKRGIIDLKKTELFKQVNSLYEIMVHDAADRAIEELIESIQININKEDKSDILVYGVKPHQQELAKSLSLKFQDIIKDNYNEHIDEVKKQIELAIKDGFDNSKEIEKLEDLPFVGEGVSNKLENIVTDLSVSLTESIFKKLSSDDVAILIQNFISTSINSSINEKEELDPHHKNQLNYIIKSITDNILQKLKEDISKNRISRLKQ